MAGLNLSKLFSDISLSQVSNQHFSYPRFVIYCMSPYFRTSIRWKYIFLHDYRQFDTTTSRLFTKWRHNHLKPVRRLHKLWCISEVSLHVVPFPQFTFFPSFFHSFCKAATLAKEERDSKYCVWTSYFLSLVSTKFCQSRVQYEGARLWNRFIQWNKFDFFVFYIRIMFIRWNTYFS